METIRDVYKQRLITCNTIKVDKQGDQVKIHYHVDLVTALNNVESSTDYDPRIHMISGSCFLVTANIKGGEYTYKKSFKDDLEKLLQALENPDHPIYKNN